MWQENFHWEGKGGGSKNIKQKNLIGWDGWDFSWIRRFLFKGNKNLKDLPRRMGYLNLLGIFPKSDNPHRLLDSYILGFKICEGRGNKYFRALKLL